MDCEGRGANHSSFLEGTNVHFLPRFINVKGPINHGYVKQTRGVAINSRVALRMQGSLVQEQILALYCAWGIYKGPWGRLGGIFAPLGKAHEQPEISSSVWLGYSSPRTERTGPAGRLLSSQVLPDFRGDL